MFKFARAFLLCGLLVSTLTAADQNSLADVRSEEEALQRAFIEEDGAEIGQRLKRVRKPVRKPFPTPVPKAKQVLIASDADLLKITHEIWAADENRFPDSDVVYNVRGPTLFTHVNEALLTETSGTYAKMIALFEYYDAFTPVGTSRKAEFDSKVKAFLDAILETPPIKVARKWVEEKGPHLVLTPGFRNILLQYWFTRTGPYLSSSGFVHTFVGEYGKNETTGKYVVKGLHNWVRMFLLEQAGKLIYRPDVLKRGCPVKKPLIKAIAFDWEPIKKGQRYHKSFSSAFIRTSPEVEIALYTICVLTRKDKDCPIQPQLKGTPLKISVSAHTVLDQDTIISAYPICNP